MHVLNAKLLKFKIELLAMFLTWFSHGKGLYKQTLIHFITTFPFYTLTRAFQHLCFSDVFLIHWKEKLVSKELKRRKMSLIVPGLNCPLSMHFRLILYIFTRFCSLFSAHSVGKIWTRVQQPQSRVSISHCHSVYVYYKLFRKMHVVKMQTKSLKIPMKRQHLVKLVFH